MRISFSLLGSVAALAILSAGCAGSERKLGRGMNNMTEFVRMGEIRRSMEQTSLWDGNEVAYTTGFIKGFNRSLCRTAVGTFEVLTFPFPSYDARIKPEDPVYPASYKPHFLADPSWGPDSALGFSGGDIAPMIPGSRFRVFDY